MFKLFAQVGLLTAVAFLVPFAQKTRNAAEKAYSPEHKNKVVFIHKEDSNSYHATVNILQDAIADGIPVEWLSTSSAPDVEERLRVRTTPLMIYFGADGLETDRRYGRPQLSEVKSFFEQNKSAAPEVSDSKKSDA